MSVSPTIDGVVDSASDSSSPESVAAGSEIRGVLHGATGGFSGPNLRLPKAVEASALLGSIARADGREAREDDEEKSDGSQQPCPQFLSIQDTHVLPVNVDKIFRRVQDGAYYMPDWQMPQVMSNALGPDWARLFTSFDRVPFAAASIGQVHIAAVSPTGGPARRRRKGPVPQHRQLDRARPRVHQPASYAGRLLPKGLFLERPMQVMKAEFADECDYTCEAGFLHAFGDHLGGDARLTVPGVWDGSTERVLVMEHGAPGPARPRQGRGADHRALVDFGAARAYSKAFIDDWLRLLQASVRDDRAACVEWSRKLGYLTGAENQVMLDAHVDSLTLLATPFKRGTPQPFAFGQGTAWADVTAQIRAQIPVMLQHHLTPRPQETYSLNRKLSRAFLLAARLSATVDTRAIWDRVVSHLRLVPLQLRLPIEDTALEAAFKRQMYSDPPAAQVSPMAIRVSVHPVAAPSPSPARHSPPETDGDWRSFSTPAAHRGSHEPTMPTMPTFASSSSASATSTASDSTSTRARCRRASGLQSPADRTAPAKLGSKPPHDGAYTNIRKRSKVIAFSIHRHYKPSRGSVSAARRGRGQAGERQRGSCAVWRDGEP
ncbi:hypothetical protein B0H17DRAFT_1223005 [Mycena rosella]|uniref:ABC1 atypical kinase-like domain-containing protein n=1 Tax=Mycena rosella TaxID=1033263 RepID=A0AAD7F7A4_MYCRO|nr:hypothetical protein B0H17DRAFT_1223005 [Mycena rosella]